MEAGLANEIGPNSPASYQGTALAMPQAPKSSASFRGWAVKIGQIRQEPIESHWRRGRLANRKDIVGDEPTFTGDHHSHRDALCFVVVASMQQVYNANSRAKTQR